MASGGDGGATIGLEAGDDDRDVEDVAEPGPKRSRKSGCKREGCASWARLGGVCIKHGANKLRARRLAERCRIDGCKNKAPTAGEGVPQARGGSENLRRRGVRERGRLEEGGLRRARGASSRAEDVPRRGVQEQGLRERRLHPPRGAQGLRQVQGRGVRQQQREGRAVQAPRQNGG